MAEIFKSKYTAEEIEGLLDKVNENKDSSEQYSDEEVLTAIEGVLNSTKVVSE